MKRRKASWLCETPDYSKTYCMETGTITDNLLKTKYKDFPEQLALSLRECRIIPAKFDCKCAETGIPLLKGDDVLWFWGLRRVFCLTSNKAKEYLKLLKKYPGIKDDWW